MQNKGKVRIWYLLLDQVGSVYKNRRAQCLFVESESLVADVKLAIKDQNKNQLEKYDLGQIEIYKNVEFTE